MGEENTCEVCGGTEMKLVDGFYYCVECGTQDTNVRETVVEHTALADGEFAIATSKKVTVKVEQGVEMSPEWYRWHTYNFMLAGLTDRLVELGVEPGFKMRVLWIWARYIRKYLNKEEFGRSKEVHNIQDKSESEEDQEPPSAEEEPASNRVSLFPMSRGVLLGVLAAALNLHGSALTPTRLRRLALHNLLPLNDALRFVPPDIDRRKVEAIDKLVRKPMTSARHLSVYMAGLRARLRLGPWRAPAVDAALAALLAELRLPRGLGALVRALVCRAPVARWDRRARFTDYELTVAAYVVVALKLCFGLDDDYEKRLSDAVEVVNNAENRKRIYTGDNVSDARRRLFSFRQWATHIRFRHHILTELFAPIAHERNARAADYAEMEQCPEPTARPQGVRLKRRGDALQLSDEVTMDIINRIPNLPPDVVSGEEFRKLLGAPSPHAALAEALAPHLPPRAKTLISEDFTKYSVDYAYKTLSLPSETGENLIVGVETEGKTFVKRLGDEFMRKYDPDIVYVRNCENKNWANTNRPRPFHVVGDGDETGPEPDADDGPAEVKLETFEEEPEDGNIFDDDFLDIKIKEEDSFCEFDDTKENLTLNDFNITEPDNHIEPTDNIVNGGYNQSDSDDDDEPRYNPETFDRAETIKKIMIAAHEQLSVRVPTRYRTADVDNENIRLKRRKRNIEPDGSRPAKTPRQLTWEEKQARDESRAKVSEIVSAYFGNLQRDVLLQVSEQVRAFIDTNVDNNIINNSAVASDIRSEQASRLDGTEVGSNSIVDISSNGTRDMELIENNEKSEESDGPAEDPVYRGGADFDEETHNVNQLYIKFTAAPTVTEERRSSDEDVDELLDEALTRKIQELKPRSRLKEKELPQFPPLVDDPDITRFNYWVKHYDIGFHIPESWGGKLAREMEENFPHSFRLVLREVAYVMRVSLAELYARVMEVERALLLRLGGARAARGGREPRQPRRNRRRTPPMCDVSRDSSEREADEMRPKRRVGRPRKTDVSQNNQAFESDEMPLKRLVERLLDTVNLTPTGSPVEDNELTEPLEALEDLMDVSRESIVDEVRPKRPVGRPRKSDVSEKSRDPDEVRGKRPVGRPRKTTLTGHIDSPGEDYELHPKWGDRMNISLESIADEVTPKRPVGRPRKTNISQDSISEEARPKRPVGRPRKTANLTENIDSSEAANEIQPRPVVSKDQMGVSQESIVGDAMPKRPVGRPRKTADLTDLTKHIEVTEDRMDVSLESIVDEVTPKRSVGRPRKTNVSQKSLDSDSDEVRLKRPVGRPRKTAGLPTRYSITNVDSSESPVADNVPEPELPEDLMDVWQDSILGQSRRPTAEANETDHTYR